jgi:DNA-binding response OmpR family regulator
MDDLAGVTAGDEIQAGDLRVSVLARRLVIVPHTNIRLTRLEASLLALLRTPEQVIGSETILEHVWEYQGSRSALVSTVHRLRRKMEPNPKQPQYLRRVGEGYVIFPTLRT